VKLPTLYSRTALGQIAEWTIEFDGADYRTHEGIVGGIITTSAWTRCVGKNAGRANATTPEQQAEREARAKWKKKCEKGHHERVEEVDTELFFEPQLAHKWKDYSDEVKWPVACQAKLDGSRLIVHAGGAFSRTGKPVPVVPHILEGLAPIFAQYPNLVLDGELYNDKYVHDFDALMSLARKTKPTEEELVQSRAELEYWVYDCCLRDQPDMPFSERTAFLRKLKLPAAVRLLQTDIARNQAELDAFYEQYLAAGYEGQMIRRLDSPYQHTRTRDLLKRKTFTDSEYQIVDIQEGRGNRAGMATRVILKMEDGRTFEAGMIGGFEYCRKLLAEKASVIGKMGTVQYQNITASGGVPRFGKFKGVRDE
jgi:DNA ligase-1